MLNNWKTILSLHISMRGHSGCMEWVIRLYKVWKRIFKFFCLQSFAHSDRARASDEIDAFIMNISAARYAEKLLELIIPISLSRHISLHTCMLFRGEAKTLMHQAMFGQYHNLKWTGPPRKMGMRGQWKARNFIDSSKSNQRPLIFTDWWFFCQTFSGGKFPLLIFIRMYTKNIKIAHTDEQLFLGAKIPKRKSYFNIFSIPISLSQLPSLPSAPSQPTEKTPKVFLHSFRMCSTQKSRFSYCGFIQRFFNYNVAYSCCKRAFFDDVCMCGSGCVCDQTSEM